MLREYEIDHRPIKMCTHLNIKASAWKRKSKRESGKKVHVFLPISLKRMKFKMKTLSAENWYCH